MSVSFNFHSQARPLPTQTITVEAPLSVQTPALVLRLRAPVESSNIEMKRSDIINCLVKEILSNKVLNDAEKVVIQDSASCINLQKLDSLETEKIRRAVSFALCDLLLVGIDPVIARTHDDQLVEAESIIEEVLVETVPNNETVKSYLDKYEMYLAKQIVQKKNKDEANKVENGVQQQIQKVVQADKQVDESRVAHVVQLGSSLTNINNQRKVVAVQFKTQIKNFTVKFNESVTKGADQTATTERLLEEIKEEKKVQKKVIGECYDTLSKF